MSTRSLIGIEIKGRIKSIYCHSDGYPENMLPILNRHYCTRESIVDLMSEGDLSYLNEDGTKKSYVSLGQSFEDNQPVVHGSVEAFIKSSFEADTEYAYCYVDGKWTHQETRQWG